MKNAMNGGKNTQPIVHVLNAHQPGVVQALLLGRRLQTPVHLKGQSVESGRDHRAVRAD
jgi:hypothetical protein